MMRRCYKCGVKKYDDYILCPECEYRVIQNTSKKRDKEAAMSIFSDHKVGALSDEEFDRLGAIENRRERFFDDRLYCQNDFNSDDCMECSSYDDCLRDVMSDD